MVPLSPEKLVHAIHPLMAFLKGAPKYPNYSYVQSVSTLMTIIERTAWAITQAYD